MKNDKISFTMENRKAKRDRTVALIREIDDIVSCTWIVSIRAPAIVPPVPLGGIKNEISLRIFILWSVTKARLQRTPSSFRSGVKRFEILFYHSINQSRISMSFVPRESIIAFPSSSTVIYFHLDDEQLKEFP